VATKHSASKRKRPAGSGILLRYRETDTAYGVSRRTATRLANVLGLSETQVIHVALAQFARQNLPGYEPDEAPLSAKQKDAIRKLQPPGRMTAKESLF